MKETSIYEFTDEMPEMILSCDTFRLRIREGGQARESLRLRSGSGRKLRGLVTSDSPRIVPVTDEFAGNPCEISFGIYTTGLSAGSTLEGKLLLITDAGEKEVPVTVSVISPAEEDAPGVRTLDDFARLCENSMRDGFRLFTGDSFEEYLRGKNRPYLSLYRGMSHNPVSYQHLEEFLVATGRKEPVRLSLDRQSRAVYHITVSQKDTLYIYRSTWGYVRAEIETEGGFLSVSRKVITPDDFIGKVCPLEYVIDSSRIRQGRLFGKILLHTVHQDLVYEIEASALDETEIPASAVHRHRTVWLVRDYLDLLLHRLDYRSWQERAQAVLREMKEEEPGSSVVLLLEAFLAYSQDENRRVMELLWPVRDGRVSLQTEEEQAVYLFLASSVGLLPDEESDIIPTLTGFVRRRPGSYLLLYLLQREKQAAGATPLQLLYEMEQCFDAGCTSPFLYLDAWNLLRQEEALLRRLSPFMIRVLRFAQKKHLMTEGVLARAAFLSGNLKQFDPSLYRFLSEGFDRYPRTDVLEAICKLVIRGDPFRKEYFRWYALAVEKDLRITRLYEYYMETWNGPDEELLPLPVRMYFAYNNTLGEKKKAVLFASVARHRKEDTTSFINYSKAMKKFAEEALADGRMDENCAVLYQTFFSRPDSPERAQQIAAVLFTHRLELHDRRIRRVIVCHHALRQESSYPVSGGVAYPEICGEDACIVFEDEKQRRFRAGVEYTLTRLMDQKETARACLEQGVRSPRLLLHVCRDKGYQMEVSSLTLPFYLQAAEEEAFTDAYRGAVRRAILKYYTEHRQAESGNVFPEGTDIRQYAAADKAATAELLIRGGAYDSAYRVVTDYGTEGISPELLQELFRSRIEKLAYARDDRLLKLTETVYRGGTYDEVILQYLSRHSRGTVREMDALWEKASDLGIDTRALEERILLQAMTVRTFPVHEEYMLSDLLENGGSRETGEGYLCWISTAYFLHDRETHDSLFDLCERYVSSKGSPDAVCSLALLRHFAETDEWNPEREELARSLLLQMNAKGLRFDFYRQLPAGITQSCQIDDRIFVQIRLDPDARVILHYRLDSGDGSEGEWVSEPMRNLYHGIFVREFLLFYGETLTYDMSIMEGGSIRKTEQTAVTPEEPDTAGRTRYRLLNRMLEASGEGKKEEYRQAMEEYLRQSSFVGKFLHIL